MPVIRINERIYAHLNALRKERKVTMGRGNYSWNDLFYDCIREDTLRYQCNMGSSSYTDRIKLQRDPPVTFYDHHVTPEALLTKSNYELGPEKLILDVCCGGRMWHFDKKNPYAIYMDIEPRASGILPLRPNFKVEPDIVGDFRKQPFPDQRFPLVLFDPPHIRDLPQDDFMRGRYGNLNGETWKYDLTEGFKECWRVCKPEGSIVFKWSENDIPLKEVLSCFPVRPVVGQTTSKHGRTKFCVFFKPPAEVTPCHGNSRREVINSKEPYLL